MRENKNGNVMRLIEANWATWTSLASPGSAAAL